MSEIVEVRAPVENVNDETIAILRWLVENGDRVEKDTPLLLAETTKTSFDIPAPCEGFIWRIAPDQGEVATGSVLCLVGSDLEALREAAGGQHTRGEDSRSGGPVDVAAVHVQPVGVLAATPDLAGVPRFSEKARILLDQHGLSENTFIGRGLVRERDVLEFVATRSTPPASGLQERRGAAPPTASSVPVRIAKLPRSKRVEAQYLRSAQASTIPSMATVSVPTRGFFSRANRQPELLGLPGAIVVFEAAKLLRAYPVFNAYHCDEEVRYYEDINVGYALDSGKGLKVPVIRHADRKTLPELITEKQQRLVEYLSDTLPLEALAGGTFTISDLSGDDVFHFNPVLNHSQSAILGICAEFIPPEGTGAFNLVLTFDHQLAEGRLAAAFLRELRDRLRGHEAAFGREREDARLPACSICLRTISDLSAGGHPLIKTIQDATGGERLVCSICLQLW